MKKYKPNGKQKKEMWQDRITWIVIILCVGAILFFGTRYFLPYVQEYQEMKGKAMDTEPDNLDEGASYINEVHYIGGIGYKEVYDTPFQKSDSFYVSNKELWKKHPDIIQNVSDAASEFMDKIINTGYRKILEDEEVFLGDILSRMDQNWTYYDEKTDAEILCADYMRNYAEYVIDSQLSVSGAFLTDTSLVYEDGLLFVRGMAEYTVFSSVDENVPSDGVKRAVMVEVALHRGSDDPGKYEVVEWRQIGEPFSISD